MKAILDGIYSPDLPSGYGELPSDPKNCWIVIHADIGADDESGGMDTFTFYVCTAIFLQESLVKDRFTIGHSLIILKEFDWNIVEEAINDICSTAVADNWEGIVTILSRYGDYEL